MPPSRNPETRAWQQFAQDLPGFPACQVTRIEGAGNGVPDVHICWLGTSSWIENKMSSGRGRLKFQPGQVPWLVNNWYAGGNAWVLVFNYAPTPLLYPGRDALELAEDGCSAVDPYSDTLPDIFWTLKYGRR